MGVGGNQSGGAVRSRLVWFGVLALGFVWGSCGSAPRADLRHNEALYMNTGYRVALPVDLPAYVAGVRDARTAVAPAAAGDSTYYPMSDGAWERPVRVMVDDILRDELRHSQVVTDVLERVHPDALVLQPSLLRATCGSTEEVSGGRTLAEVELRLQVFGPVDAEGVRPLLRDEVYSDRQVSQVMMRPPQPVILLGHALRRTMFTLLQDLDTSNVSRPGVPPATEEPVLVDPALQGKQGDQDQGIRD